LFYPQKLVRLSLSLTVFAENDNPASWQVVGLLLNEGNATAETMLIRLESNQKCQFGKTGNWAIVREWNEPVGFITGPDGKKMTARRAPCAELLTQTPLHPGSIARPFSVRGLEELRMFDWRLKVTVFSRDNSSLVGEVVIPTSLRDSVYAMVFRGAPAELTIPAVQLIATNSA
jgi:hypothetical protein